MTYRCPRCGSDRIATKGYARRAACAVGMIAGAVGGAAGATTGAELGAVAGLVAGPPGAVVGGVAGAVLGEVVDENILDNFVCLSCEFSFGKTNSEVPAQEFYES